ncbi:hypothetical protein [Singulisphaera acidiphila]|uniref:hypothetical protein n=1 Tax=Singulisphaera acidiphila TaxID=466153 RepID=UPI0012B5A121|nr:hypothetical protein [Singulisphaera acidiphila]
MSPEALGASSTLICRARAKKVFNRVSASRPASPRTSSSRATDSWASRAASASSNFGARLCPTRKEEPGSGAAKEVPAYLKKVPQDGGLMLDRTLRNMTAEEFKAAPQAGTPTPSK